MVSAVGGRRIASRKEAHSVRRGDCQGHQQVVGQACALALFLTPNNGPTCRAKADAATAPSKQIGAVDAADTVQACQSTTQAGLLVRTASVESNSSPAPQLFRHAALAGARRVSPDVTARKAGALSPCSPRGRIRYKEKTWSQRMHEAIFGRRLSQRTEGTGVLATIFGKGLVRGATLTLFWGTLCSVVWLSLSLLGIPPLLERGCWLLCSFLDGTPTLRDLVGIEAAPAWEIGYLLAGLGAIALLCSGAVGQVCHRTWGGVKSCWRGLGWFYLHHIYMPWYALRASEIEVISGPRSEAIKSELASAAHTLGRPHQGGCELDLVQSCSGRSLRIQNIIGDLQASQKAPFTASLPSSPKGFLVPSLKRALSLRSQRRGLLLKQSKLWESLVRLHGEAGGVFARVPLKCRRGAVFDSSVDHILAATQRELVAGINVLFGNQGVGNEAGIDSGGLTREWFQELTTELVALPGAQASVAGTAEPMFRALPDNSLMLNDSTRPPAHYLCLGRIVAMCVIYNARGDPATLPVSLSTALLKFILNREVVVQDVRALDPIYFKNRIQMLLEPGGIEMMKAVMCLDDLTFVELDEEWNPGEELKPGGAKISVTEENKDEYVMLVSERYLCGKVRHQISSFLAGFWDLVPLASLEEATLDEKDLALLISGVPSIDVKEWQASTEVTSGSSQDEALVGWLWEILEEMDPEARARVLQFATGLSHLPASGFGALEPRFEVTFMRGDTERLPTAHTCFNRLELPPYRDKETLQAKLKVATSCSTGFGLA